MCARPDMMTWLEAVSVANWSNEMGVSMPHFAIGADNPGDGYVAMWSDRVIVDEIVDLADCLDNNGDDTGGEFDFLSELDLDFDPDD